MKIVELIDAPDGTTTEHGLARRYQRFETERFVASPSGTLRLHNQSPDTNWTLDLSHEPPRFEGEPRARLFNLNPSIFRVDMSGPSVIVRVVSPQTPSLAWPSELDEAISRVAAGPSGLDVLADTLLEHGHPLGERLRGLGNDADWLGELPVLELDARFDFAWTRGVALSAVARGVSDLERLSAHVATHLVQRLDVIAWTDELPTVELIVSKLESLLKHRLPWLGSLRIHGLPPTVGSALKRSFRTDRASHGCTLETPRFEQLSLVTDSRSDRVPDRGFMQVGNGSPMSFVRLRHSVLELTVARSSFVLNGLTRSRITGARGPWVLPLTMNDQFTVDDRSYAVAAAR